MLGDNRVDAPIRVCRKHGASIHDAHDTRVARGTLRLSFWISRSALSSEASATSARGAFGAAMTIAGPLRRCALDTQARERGRTPAALALLLE
jgi:hypothetical protein